MTLTIRPAHPDDAPRLAGIINPIIAIGGTTAYRIPFTPQGLIDEFPQPISAISGHAACDAGVPCGFQSLSWSDPDWAGPDAPGPDRALIATYVATATQGKSVGAALFDATRGVAKAAGVAAIAAIIRRNNAVGRACCSRIGFVPWRDDAETIWQRCDL